MTNPDDRFDSDIVHETPPAAPFSIGDRVKLRSGGMSMTVINVLPDGIVVVAWSAPGGGFSLWGEGAGIRRETFPAICLEKA